jgi:CBS domain-containing protein
MGFRWRPPAMERHRDRDQLARGPWPAMAPPVTVSADITLVEGLDSVSGRRHTVVPVVDAGRLVGTTLRERRKGARDPCGRSATHTILMQTPTLAAEESLTMPEWLGDGRATCCATASWCITRHRRHRTLVPAGDRGTTGPAKVVGGANGAVGAAAPYDPPLPPGPLSEVTSSIAHSPDRSPRSVAVRRVHTTQAPSGHRRPGQGKPAPPGTVRGPDRRRC